jgi:hypothetical protein
MQGINSSVFVRLPFAVTNLEQLEALRLKARYNDGFVAYLNGTVVAVRNGPFQSSGGILAESSTDWAGGGQQGLNNWYYGLYDRSQDADRIYDPQTDFDSLDPNWTWNGGAWVLGPSNPPWDLISASGWHPNGVNSGSEHWVVRRWVSETGGFVKCGIHFAKENTGCGSGTTLRVLHNGQERFAWTVAYNDPVGVVTNVVLWGLQPGDFLDFALDPLGTDGSSDDPCDGSTFAVTIEQDPSEGPKWDSTATAVRSTAESLQIEEIDLTRYAGLLVEGQNILALHGLNSSKDDPNFLLVPELEAVYSGMDSTVHGYFLIPTPGLRTVQHRRISAH